MAYQAIYRKWRPMIFEDIVGQGHITKTLRNQISAGKVSHAYLFCGTRGTGKTTAAKVFARAVNCQNPKDGSPCNECEICRGIIDGSIMDVTEIDAASNNGVDNIREIREDVNYVATQARYRVYIIDEVHMLSQGAFNALLKTLEEPPAHVIFILATTEPHKIPETILSRCQRYDFKRIRPSDIITRMKEIAYGDGITMTDECYNLVARLADGSMRDGLSILERCVSAYGTNLSLSDITDTLGIPDLDIVTSAVDAIADGDASKLLSLVSTVMNEGRDIGIFIDNLTERIRNLMVIKLTDDPSKIIDASSEELVKLKAQAEKLTFEKLNNSATLLSEARADAKWVKSPRMIYELALIKLVRPQLDDSREALEDRLASLEEKVKNGITVEVVKPQAEEEKKTEPKEKPKPSAKLFAPIDKSTLTATHPIVVLARRWDKLASEILRAAPHFATFLHQRRITIDGEGLLLLFANDENGKKKAAAQGLEELNRIFKKKTGSDYIIKLAFTEEVEDQIIDYWAVGDGKAPVKPTHQAVRQEPLPKQEEAQAIGDTPPSPPAESAEDLMPPSLANRDSGDLMDRLLNNFSEIVELADSSEFLEYQHDSDSYSQEELDDDENEEFLEENELSDNDDE